MPSTRRSPRTDGEQTRSRILDSAGRLFAATGYAETTSKAIAADADVDVASINYHFGNREGLYQTVLAEAHRRLIQPEPLLRLSDSALSPRDKLARLIDTLLDGATGPERWPAGVLAREVLAPSSNLRVLLDQELQPKLVAVRRILSEITGFSPDDPALLRCLLSIGAPCLVLLVARDGLPGPLQPIGRMSRAELASHLLSFALGGLEAIARKD